MRERPLKKNHPLWFPWEFSWAHSISHSLPIAPASKADDPSQASAAGESARAGKTGDDGLRAKPIDLD